MLVAYLQAAQRDGGGRPAGLLVYAQVGEPLSEVLTLEGFPIHILMLDLTQPWEQLRAQLLGALEPR